MSKLDAAREAIRKTTDLSEELRKLGEDEIGCYAVDEARLLYYNGARTMFLTEEVSSKVLAESFSYFIDLDTKSIADEHKEPLGISKYKGLPHLPKDMEWPAEQFFAAQLNLAELHPHDIEGVFPATGMLYFFFNGAAECTVVHYDGPLDELEVRPYPDESTLPGAKHYLKDFLKASARMTLEPSYVFYLDGDAYDHRNAAKLMPKELIAQLDSILGCSLARWDGGHRIFGRPLYWQGEDECWDDDDASDEPDILLYQDEFGEGNVHFWLSREAAKAGDFSQVWMSYSGT